jgi:hypothetical protein
MMSEPLSHLTQPVEVKFVLSGPSVGIKNTDKRLANIIMSKTALFSLWESGSLKYVTSFLKQ